MKVRKFIVELSTHEENLCGASFGHATTIGMAEFAPTVKNVRQAVKNFFPSREIDERDMTLAEQVQDSLEYGFFSVDLKVPDCPEFYSESLTFMEV